MPDASKPRIAITVGDPAGIGPEVVLKALADEDVRRLADVAVFGPPLDEWNRLAGQAPPFLSASCPSESWDGHLSDVQLICPAADLQGLRKGGPSPTSGEASIRYIMAAIDAAQRGRVEAIVTGPISKEAIHLAGYPWPGHTELLAEKFGAADVAMMFAGGPFRVILVTIHLALADAIRAVTTDRIVKICRLGSDAVRRWFGVEVPRLGVCGLNPHAGEAGRFGYEEREIIEPAIEEARNQKICAFGPLPPDTAFYQAAQGKFDLIVAMYHDQGLIPLKTVAFEDAVNVTVGLPIIRTSVDHGTAYEIAGRGEANPRSMKAAIRLAIEMVQRDQRSPP